MKQIFSARRNSAIAAMMGASILSIAACAGVPESTPAEPQTSAQEESANMAELPDPYLGFTKFIVKDLDTMEAFYVDVFGFERANVIANDALEERIMRLPGGTTSLVLYHYKDGREIIVGNGHGPVGLMTRDVDGLHLKALANGASEKMAPVNFGPSRLSFLLDPEGHELELINMTGGSEE